MAAEPPRGARAAHGSGFNWDVAPLPTGKQLVSILHTDGYCIAAASQNKDLAWKFVEYANGPEGQVITAKTGRSVPSLRSVALSPTYLDSTKPPANNQVFLDMAPYLHATPQIGTWPDIELRTTPPSSRLSTAISRSTRRSRRFEQGTAADFQQEAYPSTLVPPTPVPGRPGEDLRAAPLRRPAWDTLLVLVRRHRTQ